jgi:hypothetical protein
MKTPPAVKTIVVDEARKSGKGWEHCSLLSVWHTRHLCIAMVRDGEVNVAKPAEYQNKQFPVFSTPGRDFPALA